MHASIHACFTPTHMVETADEMFAIGNRLSKVSRRGDGANLFEGLQEGVRQPCREVIV